MTVGESNVDAFPFRGNKSSEDNCKLLLFPCPTYPMITIYMVIRKFGTGISIMMEGWKWNRYAAYSDAEERLRAWGYVRTEGNPYAEEEGGNPV